MNKTITITINSILFYIEENAYKKLDHYLHSIQNHFSTHEDKEEIIADIESRIAEKFLEKTEVKKFIALADVEDLIKNMGTVEDFIEFENEKNETPPSKKYKKLYRDPEDKIIAGVASGLGAYFNVSPTIIRLLFILSVFAGGFGILVYVLLWILVPEAKTTTQKIEMHGDPVTLVKIEEKIKSFTNDLKNKDSKVRGSLENGFHTFFEFIGKIFRTSATIFKKLFLFCCKFAALFLVVFSVITVLASLIIFLVLLLNIDGLYIDNIFRTFLGVFYYNIILTSVFLFISTFFLTVLLGSISILKKKNMFKAKLAVPLISIWTISFVTLVVTSIFISPQFILKYKDYEANYYNNSKDLYDEDFSKLAIKGNFKVNIKQDSEAGIVAYSPEQELQYVNVKNDNGYLSITQTSDFKVCAFCYSKPILLEVHVPYLEDLSLTKSYATVQNFEQNTFHMNLSEGSAVVANLTTQKLTIEASPTSSTFLKGSAGMLEVSGGGVIHALDFPVDNAILAEEGLHGPGVVEINVKQKLSIPSSSSRGRVLYLGEPIIDAEDYGGRLEKLSTEKAKELRSDTVWLRQNIFENMNIFPIGR